MFNWLHRGLILAGPEACLLAVQRQPGLCNIGSLHAVSLDIACHKDTRRPIKQHQHVCCVLNWLCNVSEVVTSIAMMSQQEMDDCLPEYLFSALQ